LNAPSQDLDSISSAGSIGKGMRVPLTAIVGGDSVMRIESAGAGFLVKKVAVRIGDADDRFARIDSGLGMGDRVVAVGAHLLTDGQAVRLAP
jgi:multidrug efflux pump subunit AcrA (membrane-fusion protein)